MFAHLLEKLVRHEDLTSDEAAAAMGEVMEGRAPAASLGALLMGLVMKGERPAEIVGFARTMRAATACTGGWCVPVQIQPIVESPMRIRMKIDAVKRIALTTVDSGGVVLTPL